MENTPEQIKNRQLYRQLCQETYIPLHSKDWWLDAVCGIDKWAVAISYDKEGNIVGTLPYCIRTKYHIFRIVSNPILSIYSYIYLKLPDNPDIKANRIRTLEKKIMTDLISQIPKSVLFKMQLHPSNKNHLPFIFNNYKQTSKVSHRFEDISDTALLYKNIQHNTRTNIKKALKFVEVQNSKDISKLHELSQYSYSAKNLNVPYSIQTLKRLFAVLQEKLKCDLLYAIDKESQHYHSGLLTIRDEKCAYALIAGVHPDYRHSYSLNALYYQSILNASTHVNQYDFEGSMSPQIEHIFRNFGAQPIHYHNITKIGNPLLRAFLAMLDKN